MLYELQSIFFSYIHGYGYREKISYSSHRVDGINKLAERIYKLSKHVICKGMSAEPPSGYQRPLKGWGFVALT